jgi:hypothetical protein
MADKVGKIDDALVDKFERSLLSVDRLAVRKISDEYDAARPAFQFAEQLIVPVLERIGKRPGSPKKLPEKGLSGQDKSL